MKYKILSYCTPEPFSYMKLISNTNLEGLTVTVKVTTGVLWWKKVEYVKLYWYRYSIFVGTMWKGSDNEIHDDSTDIGAFVNEKIGPYFVKLNRNLSRKFL